MLLKEFEAREVISKLIMLMGDDPHRSGLVDTPTRVLESFKELFSGNLCTEDQIKDMMTTFDGIPYDGIVLLKDIEFFSTCEHHLLPFYGKAHIAYIPGKEQVYEWKSGNIKSPVPGKFNYRVVGISKLARLLEARSRRLQVQERLTTDITERIDKYLKPLGSACVIQARHHCVCSRGVSKQHSEMVTSSMSGTFLDSDGTSRNELFSLIYGGR
jgi:GTP cyclohydrolase IA